MGIEPLRTDRVHLGWRFALRHPHPGAPPRRPTPREHEALDPHWVSAQRREERRLNQPLRIATLGAGAAGLLIVLLWAGDRLPPPLAAVLLAACLILAAVSAYAIYQGEQAVRGRITEERRRLDRLRAAREHRLYAEQEEHARRYRQWEHRRAAYDRQPQWYAVSLPEDVDRIDVAGGTLAGWSALLTMMGSVRLSAGGELTVLDLSEGAVAHDLVRYAADAGIDPLVWVLPVDLPRLDLGVGLDAEALADVLALVVAASEDQSSTRDLSFDNAILERVIEVFGGTAALAQVTAALRALAQVGDPRDDLQLGLITAAQLDRIGMLFGRGAGDRVVIERAWSLESQLRKLDPIGTRPAPLPPSRLRVISMDRQAGVFGNKVIGTYVATALTHVLRRRPQDRPWRHTVLVFGAEKLRGDVLDRLVDACETTRTGLVMGYRSLPHHVKERLGRGNSALAVMRLGNAEDAKVASEQIGTEHRFLLSQLTETVGTSLTDTTGDSYTSTVGTSDSVSTSVSTSQTSGRSRSRGRTDDAAVLGFGDSTWSTNRDTNVSVGTTDSESLTEGINKSTAWGLNTSRATGSNESLARTVQRSREFLVEQHELQQLPPTALILAQARATGRKVVLADVNPGIMTLSTWTGEDFDEVPPSEPAAHPALPPGPARPAPPGQPVRWQGAGAPPPNLGPPPVRHDWRRSR